MKLRIMENKDLDQVVEIEADSFSRPWSRVSFEESLINSQYVFVVAENNNEIWGYCGFYYTMDGANITNIAVKRGVRSMGIGYALLEYSIEKAKELGLEAMTLEVRKSNSAAIRLYEQVGFKNAGLRRNFYESPREDAVIMWKEKI